MVSLVELLVVMVLLLVILPIGYLYYFSVTNTFARDSKQSDIQHNVQTLSDFITGQVRNATELTLLDSLDVPFSAGYNYIYFDAGTVKLNAISKTSVNINIFSVDLSNINNRAVLQFTIQGKDGSQNYQISSSVTLNNITPPKDPPKNKFIIRYKVLGD